jgi:aspartate aminotransferase-like enzyme
VTGAFFPEVDPPIKDSAFRGAVRDGYGVHIAGGQDGRGAKWKGKIFRISHMGYVDAADTMAALTAIEAELIKAGHGVAPGTALQAFLRESHG